MAQEKKGGFFSFFKKRALAPEPAAAPAAAQATRTQGTVPSVSAEQPKPAVVPKPAAATVPSAEGGVDTVASFTLLCQALVDINRSQLKMVDLALTTLAGSINTIADALKPKS
ncbi:hypothetical protein [Chlorobium sp. KB01]|uniref:hypothetical protein n=1 Tax=Chlorobium sp. KB01 TaxID=1917528 RepID=UPI000975E10A|nr:hypothetical protein [Chlorobium sp. KB01]